MSPNAAPGQGVGTLLGSCRLRVDQYRRQKAIAPTWVFVAQVADLVDGPIRTVSARRMGAPPVRIASRKVMKSGAVPTMPQPPDWNELSSSARAGENVNH